MALNATQRAYTTSAKVAQLVGTAYDSTNDVTAARVTAIISEKSGTIDDRLRGICYTFNAHDSTPATPAIVDEIAKYFSAGQVLAELGARQDNDGLVRVARTWEEVAESKLQTIFDNGGHTRHEFKASDALTFAGPSDSWDLPNNEAFLATNLLDSGDPAHIVADSVQVTSSGYTDMRFGVDFHVIPSRRYRRWVFQSGVSAFHDGTVSAPAVSYRWNYYRDFGREVVNEVYE